MKRSKTIMTYLALVLSTTVILSLQCACKPGSRSLTIAVMGDQTGCYDLDSSYSIMARAAEQMKQIIATLLTTSRLESYKEEIDIDLNGFQQVKENASHKLLPISSMK